MADDDIQRYIEAATRANTRRSYRGAVAHFEVEWGGFLPATADSVARYLAEHAGTSSINTLKLRLSALAQWHASQGFVDPTKSPLVRQVFKGIRALHAAPEKQAAPLQLAQLEHVAGWLDFQAREAAASGNPAVELRCRRDLALILLGFWRGFRSDELCRLRVEHIEAHRHVGITVFLGSSKGDRENLGRRWQTPALQQLCPVQAYCDWVERAGLGQGPVFRAVDRWGGVGERPLHANSIIPLLRRTLSGAGLDGALFSSHSLRRGFAQWAQQSGWDLKSLMSYVGWKDVKSAVRYLEPVPFGDIALRETARRIPSINTVS